MGCSWKVTMGWASVLGALQAMAVLGLGCADSEPVTEEEHLRAIKSLTLGPEAAGVERRRFPGVVQAVESSVLSFQVSGKVIEVGVRAGDAVTQGDVLARVDAEPFELRVRSAEAELAKREADYRNRDSDYRRKLQLSTEGVVSASELDLALANRDASGSSVAMARSELEMARRDQRNTVLRAPFDGSISKRSVEPHVDVASGQEVFRIDAKGALEVELRVPESIINRIEIDMPGAVTVSTLPGTSVRGFVSELGTRAIDANAFPVTLQLVETPPGLRPGMTAEAEMALSSVGGRGGHLLPATAILPGTKPDEDFVFVYHPDTQRVEKRRILIAKGQKNMALVVDGLGEGDIVAVAGASFLSDGMKVRLLEESAER